MSVYGVDIVDAAMQYDHVPYVYGAEADHSPGHKRPTALDCSELTELVFADLGLYLPDGTTAQERFVTHITVEQAIDTPGALLHATEHVAISRGDGTTIEARGRAYGTGVFGATGRGIWLFGGLHPGVIYQDRPVIVTVPSPIPITSEDDMAWLVQADDNDTAVFVTDGVMKSWVRDGLALADLRNAGIARGGGDDPKTGPPIKMNRGAIDSLTLVGLPPVYEEGYPGMRTTK